MPETHEEIIEVPAAGRLFQVARRVTCNDDGTPHVEYAGLPAEVAAEYELKMVSIPFLVRRAGSPAMRDVTTSEGRT